MQVDEPKHEAWCESTDFERCASLGLQSEKMASLRSFTTAGQVPRPASVDPGGQGWMSTRGARSVFVQVVSMTSVTQNHQSRSNCQLCTTLATGFFDDAHSLTFAEAHINAGVQ